jgi:pimeloyl-ACP methyl ester carboxylesterase
LCAADFRAAHVVVSRPHHHVDVLDDDRWKMRAHRGFLNRFKELLPGLLMDLRDQKRTAGLRRLTLTGHSMGGCVAALAALHLAADRLLDVDLSFHAFGTPAFADPRVGQLMQEMLPEGRFVDLVGDPVTLISVNPRFARVQRMTVEVSPHGVASCPAAAPGPGQPSPARIAQCIASITDVDRSHGCDAYVHALGLCCGGHPPI